MTTGTSAQAAQQQTLQVRRKQLVRELKRVEREIASAERQLTRVHTKLSALAPQVAQPAA